MRLGDAHQSDLSGRTPCPARCCLDALPHLGNTLTDGHAKKEKARARRPRHTSYMIAVGGAGSSGLPALASGTFIMTKINTAMPIRPEREKSPMFTCQSWCLLPTTAAMTRPHNASPAIKPDAVSTPALDR